MAYSICVAPTLAGSKSAKANNGFTVSALPLWAAAELRDSLYLPPWSYRFHYVRQWDCAIAENVLCMWKPTVAKDIYILSFHPAMATSSMQLRCGFYLVLDRSDSWQQL
ncbi:hypothetical protein F442_10204 [Phytophthora nicotianae P10297]|nr:hypothetical protein F442_10204 [Phytophthora nicotianae P10297]